MTFEELRQRVLEAFGPGLEGTSYASVFRFCARIQEEAFPSPREGKAFVLPEEPLPPDWDGAQRAWFEAVLHMPADQAAISLWLHAFETWYALRADEAGPRAESERLAEWFEEPEPEEPDE